MAGDTVLVDGINLSRGVVLIADGTFLPITNYYDAYGDEIDEWDDEDEIAAIVAGKDDCWVRLPMSDFTQTRRLS